MGCENICKKVKKWGPGKYVGKKSSREMKVMEINEMPTIRMRCRQYVLDADNTYEMPTIRIICREYV